MKSEDEKFLDALEKGIELFNQAKFMEAYEVWEERWSEEASEGTDLLQGLLQIAVGLAKLRGGNPKGTIKLLDKGMPLLERYRPESYDIDVDALLEITQGYRATAAELVAEGQSGANTITRVKRDGDEEAAGASPKVSWWKRVFGDRS